MNTLNFRNYFLASSLTIILTVTTIMLNNIIVSGMKLNATLVALIYLTFFCFIVCIIFSNALINLLRNPLKIYISFLVLFYMIGLLPLSSYRDYVTTNLWVFLVIFSVLSISFGYLIGKKYSKFNKRNSGRSRTKLIYFFLAISYGAGIAIVFEHGFLFSNQSQRFGVSATLQYLVEMSIPLVAVLLPRLTKEKKYLLASTVFLFTLILLGSLGYRNQPILLILIVLIIYSIKYTQSFKITTFKFKAIISGIISCMLAAFSLLFIYRNETSEKLLGIDSLSEYYKIDSIEWVISIIPIHMQAREAMGVSESAIERINIINNLTDGLSLFTLDLYTLFPNFSLTGGNVLGTVVNLNDNVSLTPGLLGGLYMSYGIIGLCIFFLLIGIMNSYFWYSYINTKNINYLIYCVLGSAYLFELTNRGLFKPFYILVFIITLMVTKNSKSINSKEVT